MEYKHELEFIGIGAPLMYEICDPIGFDGLKFENKQESKRFARSINFGALDGIEFINAVGKLSTPQIKNQYGDQAEFLDYGLEWLLYGLEFKGFEFEVYYHLSKDGIYFPKMQLDFTEKDVTDGVNFVKCKLIDASLIMDYKRQADETFNAFNDKDFKQRTITPIDTFNYLRKATPVIQVSEWKNTESNVMYSDSLSLTGTLSQCFFSQIRTVIKSDINNTLSFLDIYSRRNGSVYSPPLENFNIIKAKNDLSNVNAKVKLNIKITVETDNGVSSRGRLIGMFIKGTSVAPNFNTANQINVFSSPLIGTDGSLTEWSLNETINLDLGIIERDNYLYFMFTQVANYKNLILKTEFLEEPSIEVTATSTAIDTVIKASRWIDLLKQASKAVNNIPLNAPKFEAGGEHYENAIFSKSMVSTATDALYFKPKDVFESVEEVGADYEINRDEIFIDTFDKYYTNSEIGIFQIIPSKDFTNGFNSRFAVKSAKFGYKKYEQDRTTLSTSNAIHTETENALPNYLVDAVLERKFNFTRDGYAKQSMIDLEIRQPSTSTESDNDIYIENMAALSAGSFGEFGARLNMQWNGTTLLILNRDSAGDATDVVFIWTALGLGTTMQITAGVNIGNYTVTSFNNSVLTLTPIGFTPAFSGDGYIKLKYYYSNVAYQTRLQQGVLLPLNNILCDIAYSLKRNMLRWGSYLATCMDYAQTTITNSYFKSNGAFTSQLLTEIAPITENGSIQYSELNEPIVNARLPKLQLVAEFNDVVNYMEAYNTDKGFIRCYDMQGNVIKGYVQSSDYNPFTNEFNVTLEQKKESQILYVIATSGNLTINGVNYGLNNWYEFKNDFIKFYDKNSIPITNFYKYNLVNLNGIIYSSAVELNSVAITWF